MRRSVSMLVAGMLAAAGLSVLAAPAGAGALPDGPFPADAQIKIKGVTGFVGDNIYGTDIGQTLSTFAGPAQKAIFIVRAQNEKVQRNRIATFIEYDDCYGTIQVFYGGEDVTEDVFTGNFVVRGIPGGAYYDLRVKLKVAPGEECFVVFGVESWKFNGDADIVVADAISSQPGGVM